MATILSISETQINQVIRGFLQRALNREIHSHWPNAFPANAATFRSAWRLLPAFAAILIPARVLSKKSAMLSKSAFEPTVSSDEAGQFVIENLERGIYDIFGESNAAGYPNTALSFYPNEGPIKVTLGNMGTATVVLVLGPDRARIQLDWVPRVRRRIPSRPALLHRRPFPV